MKRKIQDQVEQERLGEIAAEATRKTDQEIGQLEELILKELKTPENIAIFRRYEELNLLQIGVVQFQTVEAMGIAIC